MLYLNVIQDFESSLDRQNDHEEKHYQFVLKRLFAQFLNDYVRRDDLLVKLDLYHFDPENTIKKKQKTNVPKNDFNYRV